MTVKEIIEYTDKVRPNDFDQTIKLDWINQVDGIVQAEIMKIPPEKIRRLTVNTDTLSVKHPYCEMYSLYVIAMLHLFTGNTEGYESFSKAYNDAMSRYAKYVARGGI